jgi:hypothetical protein
LKFIFSQKYILLRLKTPPLKLILIYYNYNYNNMTHFLNNRSCNDDYCPTEKIMIIPPAMLKINKHLNNIDTQLEALYNISEPNINEEHEEPRQPFDEHEEEIIEYAKRYDLSIAEAVDYLKTCHHCGNPDIPFGWEYCNERCQDYSIEFCYDCYRKSKCKVCDNWYRHDPWRQDEEEEDYKMMTLGVAHGLSRYKLKFSAEKVDIMIIQAVSLLDDLDKEINNYTMRLKEWYGWHFP